MVVDECIDIVPEQVQVAVQGLITVLMLQDERIAVRAAAYHDFTDMAIRCSTYDLITIGVGFYIQSSVIMVPSQLSERARQQYLSIDGMSPFLCGEDDRTHKDEECYYGCFFHISLILFFHCSKRSH